MEPQLMLLVSVLVVVTAVLGGLWLARVRAARRFRAVVDAYAEREVSRDAQRSATAPRSAARRG